MIGGAAFNDEADPRDYVDADAYAGDAGSALEVADNLFRINGRRSIA
jgi:methanogenic corrinoid protein MtbC1